MARLLKSMFGGAYTYDDLVKESTPFLNKPKLPDGLPAAMALFDGRTRTFLEFIQGIYKDFLKQVAEKPTRDEQRVEILALLLQENTWRAVQRAAQDATRVESWGHFTKGSQWFEPYPQADWKRLLHGRYIAAILLGSWIFGIGSRLYALPDYVEPALELFLDYDTEIKKMDVGFFEVMFDKIAAYDDNEGMKIATFKDEVVNPLMREQYAILDHLAADIKNGRINVDFYRSEFSRIDSVKQHLARALAAMSIPT